MLGNIFFLTTSINPDLPPETWTLVYEKITAGNYSYNADWGKYKIEISGGAGSGAALIRVGPRMEFDYCEKGFNGEEQTIYLDVFGGGTKALSGIIGSGGEGGTVSLSRDPNNWYRYLATSTYGDAGIGYDNGNQANTNYAFTGEGSAGAWVGGSGGGSTSFNIDNTLERIIKGGNGGSVNMNFYGYRTSIGGAGGSGGTTTGSGAIGGDATNSDEGLGTRTSSNGSDGYIRIYKSNLKPEPV